MNIKSERLKKLESELGDLDQWLKLGLVPKKDLEKHKEEIKSLQEKVLEEKERLRYLKENGDVEEFNVPKRPAHGRPAFQEPHSLPDIDIGEEGMTDLDIDMETESFETSSSTGEDASDLDNDSATSPEDEEDPFSDRNRWKRGILDDPESNDW
jgi:hypothetical protein